MASEDLRKAFKSAQKMIRIKCTAAQLAVMDRYYSMRQDLISSVQSRTRGVKQLRKWSFSMMRWLEEVVNALLAVRKDDLNPPRPRFHMDLDSNKEIPAENLRQWFEGLLDVVLNIVVSKKNQKQENGLNGAASSGSGTASSTQELSPADLLEEALLAVLERASLRVREMHGLNVSGDSTRTGGLTMGGGHPASSSIRVATAVAQSVSVQSATAD